jgi:hypothetical protein
MSLVEKLKAIYQLNRLVKEIKMLDKVKGVLGKLDGLKSTLGLLGVVVYYVAPQFGLHIPDVVLSISTGLAGVGIAMKLEKGLGMLTKALDILGKVVDVSKKVVEALKTKEEVKPNA